MRLYMMIKNSFESEKLTQLHKIVSDNKHAHCCEYLEVTVRLRSGAHPSLIMERVSNNEYHGYAQWFRKEFRPKVDEKPDIRMSLGTMFLQVVLELG